MALTLGISCTALLAMMVCILFFPRIRFGRMKVDTYWVAVLFGALCMILFRQVDLPGLWEALTGPGAVNPLKILVLFLSMTMLSIFLDEVGFFGYLASRVMNLAGHGQMPLFVALYVAVSVLTVFTSNDIVVLTFTPFIYFFAKDANINPRPYLVAEFVAANTMSMTLLIGNPTNIYIASSYGIRFLDYAKVMVLPTLASSVVAFVLLFLLFRKSLKEPVKVEVEKVRVENKAYLIIGLVVLGICTVLLAVGSYIGLDMWLVSLASALVLFLLVGLVSIVQKRKPLELGATLKRAPWELAPFLLSMFVLIFALSGHGITEWIGEHIGQENMVWKYGIISFLSANILNNIPMSVLFCPVIGTVGSAGAPGALYATVIGSNLGAYLTPVGALAGIMWMSMLKEHGVRFTYLDFLKYGAAVSIPTPLTALGVLSLVL